MNLDRPGAQTCVEGEKTRWKFDAAERLGVAEQSRLPKGACGFQFSSKCRRMETVERTEQHLRQVEERDWSRAEPDGAPVVQVPGAWRRNNC